MVATGGNKSPPWREIEENQGFFIDPDYLPTGFQLRDPSRLNADSCTSVLSHWRNRRERGEEPFLFRQVKVKKGMQDMTYDARYPTRVTPLQPQAAETVLKPRPKSRRQPKVFHPALASDGDSAESFNFDELDTHDHSDTLSNDEVSKPVGKATAPAPIPRPKITVSTNSSTSNVNFKTISVEITVHKKANTIRTTHAAGGRRTQGDQTCWNTINLALITLTLRSS